MLTTNFGIKESVSIDTPVVDTNETSWTERSKENIPVEVCEGGTGVDDVVDRIKHCLLGETLGEDGGLGEVKVKSVIHLEDTLEFSQDLSS